jgi:hypothetical protein
MASFAIVVQGNAARPKASDLDAYVLYVSSCGLMMNFLCRTTRYWVSFGMPFLLAPTLQKV